jgi:hypothetical protein
MSQSENWFQEMSNDVVKASSACMSAIKKRLKVNHNVKIKCMCCQGSDVETTVSAPPNPSLRMLRTELDLELKKCKLEKVLDENPVENEKKYSLGDITIKETIDDKPTIQKSLLTDFDKDAYGKVDIIWSDDVSCFYTDGLLEEARKVFAENLHRQVIDFLALLRRLHPDVEYAGQNGKCFVVSKLLCDRFVGEIWYDVPGHITTKIGERHYDITGEVSPHPSAYRLTDELVFKRAEEWDKDWRDRRS